MAMSVELTDFERVAGFVNPGSEVAIFGTAAAPVRRLPDGTEQTLSSVTRIILARVPVIGVGTTSVTSRTTTTDEGEQVTEEVPRTILTVAVTQEEAEKLVLADRTTDLTFALLGERDQVAGPARRQPGRHPAGDVQGGRWMTAIVETDRSRLSVLQAMLHGSVPLESMEALTSTSPRRRRSSRSSSAPRSPCEDAAVFAQWARVHKPDLGVILLRETVDAHALSTALRSGMREVVESQDLAGLTTAVSRARAVSTAIAQTMEDETQAAAQAAASAALSEAHAQADGRARGGGAADGSDVHRVLDQGRRRQEPDGGQHRGLARRPEAARCASSTSTSTTATSRSCSSSRPMRTLNDLAAFHGEIDVDAIETLVTPYSKTLGVVAAPVHLDSPDQATNEDIGKLLDLLVKVYDYVVVDTSGVFDDHALTALDRTDTLVLVGTLDIPALKGLKLATQTLDLLNFPREKWRFVLNRADAKVGSLHRRVRVDPRPQGRLLARLEPRGADGGQPRRAARPGLRQPPQQQGHQGLRQLHRGRRPRSRGGRRRGRQVPLRPPADSD